MSNNKFFHNYIENIIYLLITLIMVLSSSLLEEKEIIFPEIGAICVGLLLTPNIPWKTTKPRLFLCLLICGFLGMGIVRYIPLTIIYQMIIAYALALLIVRLSKTTFMPMISAMVLPVLLQTRSIWYIISLIFFTGIIILSRIILEKKNIKSKEEQVLTVSNNPLPLTLFRLTVASAMIIIALLTGWKFMVAPPLLVAFTELSSYQNKIIRIQPIKIVLMMFLSAISGAWVRLLILNCLNISANLALIISVTLSVLIFFIPFYKMGPMIPPAGAIVLLAYLVPEEILPIYPVQILLGIGTFVIVICIRNYFISKKSSTT